MMVWPHKGRLRGFADAEPVASPVGEAFVGSGSAPTVQPLTPAAAGEPIVTVPVDAPLAGASANIAPRRLRRRWLLPAALLSGAAHAAAIYALVSWLDLRSVEAETDEVSIEIVVEPPEMAGAAAEELNSEAADANPPNFQPPDPFVPQLTEAPAVPKPEMAAIVTPDLPAALDGPPQMPPVRAVTLPEPESLAVLAAPPEFEPAAPLAAKPEPQRKLEPEHRQQKTAPAKQERAEKPAAKPQQKTAQPVPGPKPARKKAVRTAKDTLKAEQAAQSDKKRELSARGSKAAAGVSGKGAGEKNRKQGETGRTARAASGGAAAYGALVNRQVQRHRRYPAEAERAGIKGVVRVSIRIDSSGRLTAASLKTSSGHAILDREALATVRRAAPFPKPPAGVAPASFSLSLRFSR